MRTTPIERTPATLTRRLGIAAGAVVTPIAIAYSTIGGIVAVGGLVLVVWGLLAGTRRIVTVGAVALLGGVLYAGLAGAPAVLLLGGVGASVFAWDSSGFSIDLGAQLGREAATTRLEVVHAVASAAVALATAGVGYAVYLTATGGQPMAALLLLLLAGMVLVAALDRS